MKPIAVLSRNLEASITWIVNNYANKGHEINLMQKKVKSLFNNQIYIIISNYHEAAGGEFSGYLIAPDYYSLEEYVKSRVK